MTVRKRDFRMRQALEFQKPDGLTKQSMAAECDINRLMAKYQKTGLINHFNRYQGRYEDVSDPVSFQEALNIVRSSETMFMTLPSSVRARFENDPGQFVAFVGDPANAEEMIRMGLATRRPEELPDAPREPIAAPPPAAAEVKPKA